MSELDRNRPANVSYWEHLTSDQGDAQSEWRATIIYIKKLGLEKILEKPTVLDIGGGCWRIFQILKLTGHNLCGH